LGFVFTDRERSLKCSENFQKFWENFQKFEDI